MAINIHSYKALLVLIAAAILAAGLMSLVGAKPAWAADRSFSPAPNSPFLVGDAIPTVTADFNGDSKADLAAANTQSDSVSVLFGNGDGTFQTKQDFAIGGRPYSLTTADFNSDGKTDLASANFASGNVSVLLGNGDGTFQAAQNSALGFTFSTREGHATVTSKDFNGDDKADLVTANYSFDSVSVLLGRGDGTFEAAQSFPVGDSPVSITSANFNGDDKADLVTANDPFDSSFPDSVSVLLGRGDGTFQAAQSLPAGINSEQIITADFNGDGKEDLATANWGFVFTGGGSLWVYLGNGDGTFQAPSPILEGDRPSSITAADFDRDGNVDLAATRNAGVVSSNSAALVLFGYGDGTFQDPQTFAVGEELPSFVIGADLNADSYADLTVTGRDESGNLGSDYPTHRYVSVLLNTAAPPNTTITSSPPSLVNSASATFEFSSSEAGSTFECSLNGSAYSPCTSPQSYSGLLDGSYIFYVKATNAVGPDRTPATHSWRVDTTAPAAPVINSPANNSFDTDGNITLSGTTEPNSTVEIFEGVASRGTASMDASGAWSKTLSGVSNGSHTYTAKARDAASNPSGFSNPRTVKVDKVKPKVLSTTPLSGATGIAPGTNVSAFFSEAMRAGSINTNTVKLFKAGTTTAIGATVTYDAANKKAILNPNANLRQGVKYKAVVNAGVRDLAGNQLDQNSSVSGNQPKQWFFTVRN